MTAITIMDAPGRFRRAARLLLILVFFPQLSCCDKKVEPPDPASGPAVAIRNAAGAQWTVAVEPARTSRERGQGLMFRWSLAQDHGMLFIFQDVKERTFWMKNTRIPLDMIFIGPDRKILGIVENAEPYTETPRKVPGKSRWVLEVSGGESSAHGLAAGDPVYFFNFEE